MQKCYYGVNNMNIRKGKFIIALFLLLSMFVASDADARRSIFGNGGEPIFAGTSITNPETTCPAGYDFFETVDNPYSLESSGTGPLYVGSGVLMICVKSDLCDQYGNGWPHIGIDTEVDARVAPCGIVTSTTATLVANSSAINVGNASTLTWGSSGATSCAGSGFLTGGALSGSVSVLPNITTTYSVTCTGSSGSAIATAQVSVSASLDLVAGRPTLKTGNLNGAGKQVSFESVISNMGDARALGEILNVFELDINNDGSFDVLLTSDSLSDLDGKNSKKISSTNWTTVLGTHSIRAVVDVGSATRRTEGELRTYACPATTALCGPFCIPELNDGGGPSIVCSVPTMMLVADDSSITVGESTDISIQDPKNEQLCTAVQRELNPLLSGQGSVTVSPMVTTTYRLDCEDGYGGVYSPTVKVVVSGQTTSTWEYFDTDYTDFWCPITDINNAYQSLSVCPDDPEGKICSEPSLCKINSINNSCVIKTILYVCDADGSTGGSGSTGTTNPGSIVEVNELNNTSSTYVFTVGEPQCSDGIDNDGDGDIDYPNDVSCSGASDLTEGLPTQCSDGIDNDSDGDIDLADAGCSSAGDNSEAQSAILNPTVDIATVPPVALVRKRAQITVVWTARDVSSCVVTGPSVAESYSTTRVSGQQRVAINEKSTYTITCNSDTGVISDSVTVGIAPSFKEE